jgi:hypothetical protein
MKVGAEKVRGYLTADFTDAFDRYGAEAEPEEDEERDLLSPPVPPGTAVPTAQDTLFSVPPPPVPNPVPPGTAEARVARKGAADA